MEEVYAALMLHSAKQPINEVNLKKVLQSGGGNVDEAKIKALVESLEGVNIDEAIKQAVVAAAAPAAETKKEEKIGKVVEGAGMKPYIPHIHTPKAVGFSKEEIHAGLDDKITEKVFDQD